ncbi:MAG: hypothetical protein RIC19_04080 [Phaeodactylibacter sp.]|uniref:hypothetical protein n=1 Tax=Phaeodactylibacter sp. TaxID=1940289 RepID=UPI0032EDB68F
MRKTIQKLATVAIGLTLSWSPAQSQGRYVRLQGQIISSQPAADALPFHLDAYKITAGGQRQLVRLSRFSGPDYHLYLEVGHDHEVLIQMVDHPPHRVRIDAVHPATNAGDRLVMEQDFIVPAVANKPAIASTKPLPPPLPEIPVAPMDIEPEPDGLLLEWGDTAFVPPPAFAEAPIVPLFLAFEEAALDQELGGPIEAETPVRVAAYPPPPEDIRLESVEEKVLPASGVAASEVQGLRLIQTSQPSEAVETIGITTAVGAPEHPGVLRHLANTALPPAPRRARLRMPTAMVAGLTDGQETQSIARLSKGQEIQVIEYTTSDWWMVSYGAVIGWVQARYLE